MNAVGKATKNWTVDVISAWDQFWFTAVDPATLATIRLCTGLMLLYTHVVWSLDLSSFFSPQGWINTDLLQQTCMPMNFRHKEADKLFFSFF